MGTNNSIYFVKDSKGEDIWNAKLSPGHVTSSPRASFHLTSNPKATPPIGLHPEKTEAMWHRAPSSPCCGLHRRTQPSSVSVMGAAPRSAEPRPPATCLSGCVLTVTGAAKRITTKPCDVPSLTALQRGAGKTPASFILWVQKGGRAALQAAGIRTR